ncbi:MAG: SGNH/GDSL hydrolase family protein [Agriterribacter sp.]
MILIFIVKSQTCLIRSVILLLGLSLYSLRLCSQQKVIPADDPSIEYTGRFDFTDSLHPVFMYSGCMIRTGFTGTSISIQLIDDSLRNWYTVKIDDSLFSFKADKANGVYRLAKNLKNTQHTVEVSRRTEWHGGNTTFSGFMLDSTARAYALPSLKRAIEFIGNSVTCGYGNRGKSREAHFTYETEDNYYTYGALVARALNANYIGVCRSGIGMYQSYGGDTNFVQPKLYDEIAVGSKSVWDYKNNQPDIVVIELGANDLAGALDSVAFANAYISFVKKIRDQYSLAHIICAAGPDLPGDSSSKFQSYVKAIADYFINSDRRIHYFYFGVIDSNGSDWHPNLKEHGQMAEVLLPFVKGTAGW